MIKLGEKIKINEKQEICIFTTGIVIFTTDKFHERINREIIIYEDFVEKTEIQKTIFYYKAYYFDENEDYIYDYDKTTVEIATTLSLQYKKEVKTKEKTVYKNLSVSNLNLGLEIVKKINNYIKATSMKKKERRLK